MMPKKFNIANIPTPIQNHKFNGCSFLIKRDDLTGVELTGNKIRKLEYLLYDAKKNKADYIFTAGGDQSNHARATVIAAAMNGFKTKLFLWGKDKSTAEGNLFLDKVFGAEIQYLNKDEFFNVNEIMLREKEKFNKKGLNVYEIPAGGSSVLGIWGYINFMNELSKQIKLTKIKGIFTAAGSGGTSAGLLIGAAIFNLNLKIYAVNVLLPKDDLYNYIFNLTDACINKYKLNIKIRRENLIIVDGYSEEGYKNILPEKINVIKEFARQSGILFDPTYTGKAFYSYNDLFLTGMKKNEVLFVHTGGIYGAFSKRKEYL
ncbi:MAG: pyridoxal-phosphate dependent enzyme [Bacteroidetes bacterium]|nr:pyridoxal-phosphate dependent enzyme [Bacteroidota bacterium]